MVKVVGTTKNKLEPYATTSAQVGTKDSGLIVIRSASRVTPTLGYFVRWVMTRRMIAVVEKQNGSGAARHPNHLSAVNFLGAVTKDAGPATKLFFPTVESVNELVTVLVIRGVRSVNAPKKLNTALEFLPKNVLAVILFLLHLACVTRSAATTKKAMDLCARLKNSLMKGINGNIADWEWLEVLGRATK